MELLGVSDDYRCRVFPTTLSDTAQEWYWKFKPNSITSWEAFRKKFCRQFNTAWTPPVYANHLADIKQGKDESLKNYIQRFMREANRETAVGDEGKMVAISARITYRSPLWDSIHRNPISTLQQFLDRADKYMKLDDAIEKEENGIDNLGGSIDPPKNGGKKCGNNGSDHHEEKKAKLSSNEKPTKYEPQFTNYTTLSTSQAEIYLASHEEVPYKKPPPIRKEKSKRDMNKF